MSNLPGRREDLNQNLLESMQRAMRDTVQCRPLYEQEQQEPMTFKPGELGRYLARRKVDWEASPAGTERVSFTNHPRRGTKHRVAGVARVEVTCPCCRNKTWFGAVITPEYWILDCSWCRGWIWYEPGEEDLQAAGDLAHNLLMPLRRSLVRRARETDPRGWGLK